MKVKYRLAQVLTTEDTKLIRFLWFRPAIIEVLLPKQKNIQRYVELNLLSIEFPFFSKHVFGSLLAILVCWTPKQELRIFIEIGFIFSLSLESKEGKKNE